MAKLPVLYKYQYNSIPVVGLDVTPENRPIIDSLSVNGSYCPEIVHVTVNTQTVDRVKKTDPKTGAVTYEKVQLDRPVHTTIVDFADGTKCVMKCAEHDRPDTENAIANAIAKRIYGKVNPTTGIVESNGCGIKIRKLAEGAFDQVKAESEAKQKKAEAKAKHLAKQKKEHEEAVARRVKTQTDSLAILLEALKQLGVELPVKNDPEKTSTLLNEVCSCGSSCSCKKTEKASKKSESKTEEYVKPNKKFKDFTHEEKKAYWRNANKKRK